jgi:hypothetical protein
VLQQYEVEKCRYEEGTADVLLDEEVYILPFPLSTQPKVPAALQNIIDAGLARPGGILVQSPYEPDRYENAESAAQRFALAKHMYFSILCRHLGAKEVSVEQINLRTRTGTTTFDLKTEALDGSTQATVENEELETFRMQMHLRDEFTGGPPDLAKAEEMLRLRGLWADPNMQALLEMRRDNENQLLSRKLVLSLSSEAKNSLKIVGRLKVPGFVNLSVDFGRIVKEQYDYTLTVFVRF